MVGRRERHLDEAGRGCRALAVILEPVWSEERLAQWRASADVEHGKQWFGYLWFRCHAMVIFSTAPFGVPIGALECQSARPPVFQSAPGGPWEGGDVAGVISTCAGFP